MLQKICNDLNEYYIQFSTGVTDKPIGIRSMKWNDELSDDTIVFYTENDRNEFDNLQKLMTNLKFEMTELANKQRFETIGVLQEQKQAYINMMESILHRSSFASKNMFSLSKEGVILYVKKTVIDGKLFKKFFEINQ